MMRKIKIQTLALLAGLVLMLPAQAANSLPEIHQGTPYDELKKALIAEGWKPVKNLKISSSSLYAQELYEQGITEVVDCISMELDGCWFYYTKNKQTLEVKTISRQLSFEQLRIIKKRSL
jgi:hypothetical protein